MNFLQFLTPAAGAVAAGVAVPSLLILYFLKLRRREEIVPSTVLWRKAIEDLQVNAPFQRLRRNLLLLLQMLVLIALALALSQPTIPFRPSAGKTTVLLIDRSASMSAKDGDDKGITRLEEAKRRAKELVGTISSGGQAMVIAFDDRAEIVQPFTSDASTLRTAIDGIGPTDRVSKIKLAYQLADAQSTLRTGSSGDFVKPPDVWVYSDGKILDGSEVSIRSEVKYEKIGSEKSGNIGIVALSARRNYERPTEVQVFTRLSNGGPEPVQADVQLTVDGKVQKVARVNLMPDRWDQKRRDEETEKNGGARDSAEFTIEMPEAGVVRVEQMNKQGDVLEADDAATVIVPPPKQLSVLLVSDGRDPFLSKLVHSLGLSNPEEISTLQYEQKIPDGKDVILFDNYRPTKLPQNGNFIYFGTLPAGLHLKAQTSDGAVVINNDMQSVLDWKRDHPIMRNLTLTKLYAQDCINLEPASESEVLVDGVKGPMVVLHREGRNIHLAVSFDPLNSNWPFLVSWPMFLHNALQYLATTSDLSVRETYTPGSTPKLPRTNLADIAKVTVTGPGSFSRTIDIPPEGDVALPALEKVGTYELSPPVPGFEKLAVNLLDNNESDITPAGSPPGGIGTTIEATTSKARLELWWWLVLAGAIPLLLVEWFVYTRRTHM